MNEKTENLKALSSEELEQVTGGVIPNISLEEAKKYILNGIKDHLEIQVLLYYKAFGSRLPVSERRTIEEKFSDRFGHKPEASPYYPTL